MQGLNTEKSARQSDFPIFSTVFMIGSAIGPALVGYMFDFYGDYDLAFGIMAASAAMAGVLVLFAKRHWRPDGPNPRL